MPARRIGSLAAALAIGATLTLAGCGDDDGGGAEQIGTTIDDTVQDGADKLEEGADKGGDKAEDLGDKADEKTDN